MKSVWACVLASSLLSAAGLAHAAKAQWLLQGTISEAVGSGLPTGVQAGDAFSFVLNFDTDSPVSNPHECGDGGIGTTCRHDGDPTLHFSQIHWGSAHTQRFPYDGWGWGYSNIRVRNNAPVIYPGDDRVDGYSFSTYADSSMDDPAARASFGVIFRGDEDLNVVTDGRVLPLLPPAQLPNLGLRVFEFCQYSDKNGSAVDCDVAWMTGTINSVSAVPEPSSTLVLLAGLAGMSVVRLRKRNQRGR